MRSTFFLIVHFLMWNGFSQNYSYDTTAALDCSKDRCIVVNGKKILIPKNCIYGQGEYLHPYNYVASGIVVKMKQDTIQFYTDTILVTNEYLKETKLDLNNLMTAARIVSKNEKVHFIIYYNAIKDTIMYPMCGAGYGWISKAAAPIKEELFLPDADYNNCRYIIENDHNCFCAQDTNMFGIFEDQKTKEKIWVGNNFSFVKYQSLKQKSWKNLYIFNTIGELSIGFTSDRSDAKNSYTLWYSNNTWVIPGVKKEFFGEDRKPQFFRKTNEK